MSIVVATGAQQRELCGQDGHHQGQGRLGDHQEHQQCHNARRAKIPQKLIESLIIN